VAFEAKIVSHFSGIEGQADYPAVRGDCSTGIRQICMRTFNDLLKPWKAASTIAGGPSKSKEPLNLRRAGPLQA
jgi:hypothetical protein